MRRRLDHTHSCGQGGDPRRIRVELCQGSQQDQGWRGPHQLGMTNDYDDPFRLYLASRPSSIPDVVEQYAEEAAFLWCLRDAATDEPHYALRHLAVLEERIEAHIDGLRVAGDAGLSIAWGQLDQRAGPGELFVAATLSLESRNGASLERALQLAESAPPSRRGLFGALGWASRDALRGHVVAWLDDTSSFRRLA